MYSWYNLKRLYKEARGGKVEGKGSEGVVVSNPRLLFKDEVADLDDKRSSPWNEVSKVFEDNNTYHQTIRRLQYVSDMLGKEICHQYFVMPIRNGSIINVHERKNHKVYISSRWGSYKDDFGSAKTYAPPPIASHITFPVGRPLSSVRHVNDMNFSALINLVDGFAALSKLGIVFVDAKLDNVVMVDQTYKFIDYAPTFPLSLCTVPCTSATLEDRQYYAMMLTPGYISADTSYQFALRPLLLCNNNTEASDILDFQSGNRYIAHVKGVIDTWYYEYDGENKTRNFIFRGLLVNVVSSSVQEQVKVIKGKERHMIENAFGLKIQETRLLNYDLHTAVKALQILLQKEEYYGRVAAAMNIYAMGMLLLQLSNQLGMHDEFLPSIVAACTTFLRTENKDEVFIVCPSMSEFRETLVRSL